MIWDFGRTNSLIDMEKSKVQQAFFTLELAKEDLIMEAISAWLNLKKAYNTHEANKKIEANALKTLSMTIEKVKKGEASKLEQLQIEQQYRTFQTLTMTSQLAFDSAKQRFQNVWRFKPLDIANMPKPIADILGIIPDSGASVRGNTTLKIADLEIQIALGQLRYDDAEFRPRLDGKLSYTEKDGELSGGYDTHDAQKEEWRADITLSWKIFGERRKKPEAFPPSGDFFACIFCLNILNILLIVSLSLSSLGAKSNEKLKDLKVTPLNSNSKLGFII